MGQSWIELCGIGPKVEGLRWETNESLRIGRQGSSDVVLEDASVERVHAEVKRQGPRWVIRDVPASPFFPTLVNGNLVSGTTAELKLEDVVQVGQILLQVKHIGPKVHAKLESDAPAYPYSDDLATRALRTAPGHADVGAEPERIGTSVPVAPRKLPDLDLDLPDWNALVPSRPSLSKTPEPKHVLSLGRDDTLDQSKESDKERISSSLLELDLEVEARAQLSWDQTIERASRIQGAHADNKAVLTLLRANHHLSNLSNLDALLENTLADVLQTLNAQRGAFLLYDAATGKLNCKAVLAPLLPASYARAYSRTLVERCFRQGESLLCRDSHLVTVLQGARSIVQGDMNSIICALVRSPRRPIGVLHLDRGTLHGPFTESDLYLADAVAASIAVGIECAQLVELQRDQFVEMVTTLARTVEMRDQYTGDHTKRVTDYALLLAEELKLPALERYQIQVGTPLHDIGKIGVDDAVLRKPGKLTDGEFEHMKSHTLKGAEMIASISSLQAMIPIVRHHHERWDGSGYPDRLAGSQISPMARIVTIADAFDAMTSDRPYRPAMPAELAFMELSSKAGSHFDPNFVQAFLKVRHKVQHLFRE
jgi:putative nucleotidyltransferase with HDIG domain